MISTFIIGLLCVGSFAIIIINLLFFRRVFFYFINTSFIVLTMCLNIFVFYNILKYPLLGGNINIYIFNFSFYVDSISLLLVGLVCNISICCLLDIHNEKNMRNKNIYYV
jgi:hypothetical protein